jgi:hypothetical protein
MEADSKVAKRETQMEPLQIRINIYVERPVFDKEQLAGLHALVIASLPKWSSAIKASKGEGSGNIEIVTPHTDMFQTVASVAPAHGGIGGAMLTGAYEGVAIFLSTCGLTLPPELNRISIEILDLVEIEGSRRFEWVRVLFHSIARYLPVRYAHACSAAEFAAKNMISDENGTRAVGVKLDYALPGLYWLNLFGIPYVKLLGKDILLSAPAFEVREAGKGIIIALGSDPTDWKNASYKEWEQRTIAHIGQQFFFLRNEPERRTLAPDFRTELRARAENPL